MIQGQPMQMQMPFNPPYGMMPMQGPIMARPVSLYIGNLDEAVHEETLYSTFARYGPIHSLKIVKDRANGRSKGFGYINFQSAKDADSARMLSNNEKIGKNPIRLMYKRDRNPSSMTEGNTFVKNIDPNVTPKDLTALFSKVGNVLAVKIATNNKGESLSYGYVQFEKGEDAEKAVEQLNGEKLKEQDIVVEKFVPKTQRSNGTASTANKNLYVRNFPANKSKAEIESLVDQKFGEHGKIISRAAKQYQDKWFAYVCYEEPEQAKSALESLHDKDVFGTGEGLYVNWHQTKAERLQESKSNPNLTSTELFVKNLKPETTDVELKNAFSQYGDITSVAIRAPENSAAIPNLPKSSFGFINFKDHQDAARAQSEGHNKAEVKGLFINDSPYIGFKQTKEQRQQFKRTVQQPHFAQQRQRTWNNFGNGGQFNPQMPNQFPVQMGQFGGMPMIPQNQYGQRKPYNNFGNAPNAGFNQMQPGFQQQQAHDQQRGMARGKQPLPARNQGMGPNMGGPRSGAIGQQQGGRPGPNVQGQRQNYQGGQQRGPKQNQGQSQQQDAPKEEKPKQQSESSNQLTVSDLKNKLDDFLKLDHEKQRNILGELLYPKIVGQAGPTYAPKITGMLVDFDVLTVQDILEMLEDDVVLEERIKEAVELIEQENDQ